MSLDTAPATVESPLCDRLRSRFLRRCYFRLAKPRLPEPQTLRNTLLHCMPDRLIRALPESENCCRWQVITRSE